MENNEDSCNSLPYIDDAPTDEETNSHQYNVRIIENYHNQNRNIEITNRIPNEEGQSLSPVAPLADETEFTDKLSDLAEDDACRHVRKLTQETGMKLVIKGWNSSISIQGLDNKSSITFRRRCEKRHKKVERKEEKNKLACEEAKSAEKTRRGRWKMLTRSIMLAKSTRFERKGLDERYPKYVLLKNEEEEEMTREVKENYPKMFVFNDRASKPKPKPEFCFKKTFKNKTEPIVPVDEILAKTGENQGSKADIPINKKKNALTERNLMCKKKVIMERRHSMNKGTPVSKDKKMIGPPVSQGQVYSETEDIFEDTLKLLPQGSEQQQGLGYYTSLSPHIACQISCHDPYCCLPPHTQPPKYIPVYPSQKPHIYKNSKSQRTLLDQEITVKRQNPCEEAEVDMENLPFGILSSFFPQVVIMNTIPTEDNMTSEEEVTSTVNRTELENYQLPRTEVGKDPEKAAKGVESLEVPQQDLTLKSKMIVELAKPDSEIKDFYPGDVTLKEFPSLIEQKEKSQESEATEYLQYTDFDPSGNESVEYPNPTTPPARPKEKEEKTPPPEADKKTVEDLDSNSENLSLTKIGYKMYDNLTKLSLNRENEMKKKTEVSGCGCNGNGTKKSPYNITLESSNSVVKVTVPENELNFQIINSEAGDIQIGVMRGAKEKQEEEEEQEDKEEKKIVRKEELWHPDNGRRALVLRSEEIREDDIRNSKVFQKLKVSLADNKEVVFSIEMNEKEKKEEKPREKSTKDMKVGTDDFDLAGGDFVCALGGNYKNLSPRLGQLLKHLHEKLEIDKKERKFLDEKINQKLIDQKFQPGPFPGVFLVKHISPRTPALKKPAEISLEKLKKETEVPSGSLREYYCEECLATMRIFEDENPSVKSMVDKFETIIQLESF